jgi:transcriptional regulator with XRE-family HTH domain
MKEMNYELIGTRLKKLRKYLSLTQEQVASILGLGRDAIINIEKGNRKIDVNELLKFSKLYNTPMEDLIEEDPNVNYDSAAYARGFNNLSKKDKKEIMELIEYKNSIKKQA